MKSIVPLIIVMVALSGCTIPVNSALKVTSSETPAPQPTTSPGSVNTAASDKLPTNQASIESTVRGFLHDSQIATIQSTLTTVGALDDLEKHNATAAGLTADSPVWQVTVTGNLNSPSGPSCGLMHGVLAKKLLLVFSAEDGKSLSCAMVDPTFLAP